MSKTAVIAFTKDRPIQFEAYLASLLKYAKGIEEKDIFIVMPKKDPLYDRIFSQYKNVNPRLETGSTFHDTFKSVLNVDCKKYDFILFGCDDVVFFRNFSVPAIEDQLTVFEDLFGFSLRLGKNIKQNQPNIEHLSSEWFMWNWTKCTHHWGYPFELMATVYRKSDVIKLHNSLLPQRNPNDLEAFGYVASGQMFGRNKPLLAANEVSIAAAQDVNRVQDIYKNAIHGTKEHSPENLKAKFLTHKIDIDNFNDIVPDDCFIGDKYFKLVARG